MKSPSPIAIDAVPVARTMSPRSSATWRTCNNDGGRGGAISWYRKADRLMMKFEQGGFLSIGA